MWEKRLAQSIAKKCAYNGVQKSESVLCFGLELIITTLIGIGLILLIAIFAGNPWSCIPFLLGFAPLRRYAGGYHATTHSRCHIISSVIFSVCLFTSSILDLPYMNFFIISMINWIVILIFAPVSAANKPLSNEHMLKNRTKSIVIASFEAAFALGILILKVSNNIIEVFYFGALSATMSLLLAKIENKFKRR